MDDGRADLSGDLTSAVERPRSTAAQVPTHIPGISLVARKHHLVGCIARCEELWRMPCFSSALRPLLLCLVVSGLGRAQHTPTHPNACLGEYSFCPSTGECTLSTCGACGAGEYRCPLLDEAQQVRRVHIKSRRHIRASPPRGTVGDPHVAGGAPETSL